MSFLYQFQMIEAESPKGHKNKVHINSDFICLFVSTL